MIHPLKGIHYKNPLAYNVLTLIKLWGDYDLRFRIAAGYLRPKDSVLDVCSGAGEFRKYLPEDCEYSCLDASLEFCAYLSGKNIRCFDTNLRRGLRLGNLRFNALVMIVSLYQFREAGLDALLESFKTSAEKVIIVEDVRDSICSKSLILRKTMDYLCSTDYCDSIKLFNPREFEELMDKHGYACRRNSKRYMVGLYGSS